MNLSILEMFGLILKAIMCAVRTDAVLGKGEMRVDTHSSRRGEAMHQAEASFGAFEHQVAIVAAVDLAGRRHQGSARSRGSRAQGGAHPLVS